MKIRTLILMLCVTLCSSVFATNQHLHPKATDTENDKAASKTVNYPAFCEIEIINNSYDNVTVSGVFDDGVAMQPFNVYSFEAAHYISLYYYGYCHSGMNLYINTWNGYTLWSGYTPVQTSIRIVPYLANQVKAEITKK